LTDSPITRPRVRALLAKLRHFGRRRYRRRGHYTTHLAGAAMKKVTIADPQFLAACRRVFGDDSPRTVVSAIRSGDPRMNEVHALATRDPSQWFCSAIDENGAPRLWAKGDTEQEARKHAELAVTDWRDRKPSYREMVPRSEWTFVTYPPDDAA
jgi:hypothetical protein